MIRQITVSATKWCVCCDICKKGGPPGSYEIKAREAALANRWHRVRDEVWVCSDCIDAFVEDNLVKDGGEDE